MTRYKPKTFASKFHAVGNIIEKQRDATVNRRSVYSSREHNFTLSHRNVQEKHEKL